MAFKHPPLNISVLSDFMSRLDPQWAVWKSNWTTFSALCRDMERMGHLKIGRRGESVVVEESLYEGGQRNRDRSWTDSSDEEEEWMRRRRSRRGSEERGRRRRRRRRARDYDDSEEEDMRRMRKKRRSYDDDYKEPRLYRGSRRYEYDSDRDYCREESVGRAHRHHRRRDRRELERLYREPHEDSYYSRVRSPRHRRRDYGRVYDSDREHSDRRRYVSDWGRYDSDHERYNSGRERYESHREQYDSDHERYDSDREGYDSDRDRFDRYCEQGNNYREMSRRMQWREAKDRESLENRREEEGGKRFGRKEEGQDADTEIQASGSSAVRSREELEKEEIEMVDPRELNTIKSSMREEDARMKPTVGGKYEDTNFANMRNTEQDPESQKVVPTEDGTETLGNGEMSRSRKEVTGSQVCLTKPDRVAEKVTQNGGQDSKAKKSTSEFVEDKVTKNGQGSGHMTHGKDDPSVQMAGDNTGTTDGGKDYEVSLNAPVSVKSVMNKHGNGRLSCGRDESDAQKTESKAMIGDFDKDCGAYSADLAFGESPTKRSL